MKREPGASGYNWATLSLGDINTKTERERLDTRLTTLFCKKIVVAKSKIVEPGCNVAESPKEDYDSKWAVLSVMMM
jgi:hypothetical protein